MAGSVRCPHCGSSFVYARVKSTRRIRVEKPDGSVIETEDSAFLCRHCNRQFFRSEAEGGVNRQMSPEIKEIMALPKDERNKRIGEIVAKRLGRK